MVASIIQGVAAVWVSVKWPMVGQLRARHDQAALRRLLRSRFRLQAASFVIIAVVACLLGPIMLRWLSADKQLLPQPWLALVLIQGFLDMQVSFWTFLLATENRVPSLWPMLISYGLTLCLVLVLSRTTSLGIGVFALAPLLANVVFNYWYGLWPGRAISKPAGGGLPLRVSLDGITPNPRFCRHASARYRRRGLHRIQLDPAHHRPVPHPASGKSRLPDLRRQFGESGDGGGTAELRL
jgi:hypothetical protein